MKKRQTLSESALVETLEAFAKAGLVRKVPASSSRKTIDLTVPSQGGNRRYHVDVIRTPIQGHKGASHLRRIPLVLSSGQNLKLSAGGQNVLIEKIINEFCPRFTPGAKSVYVGDTEKKWAYFDPAYLQSLGVFVEEHGKIPDVVVHFTKQNWLVLIEAVTRRGPVSPKRLAELKKLFTSSKAGLVFVTDFLDRRGLLRYIGAVAWETEVWVADAPDHMIHFNGERFLGPY
jgi:hypothetical protein